MSIAPFIELTCLQPTTTIFQVEKMCTEAIEGYFSAVCVPPMLVKKAKILLSNTPVKVATAIGFPLGYSMIEAKIAEVVLAIVDGADELNMVINTCALKNNDWQYLALELNTILPIIKNKQKIICPVIECGLLTTDEIVKCCDLYGAAGVDYLGISTGFAEIAATEESVKLVRQHLADNVRIKAGADIKTSTFAKALLNAGTNRLQCSPGNALALAPRNNY